MAPLALPDMAALFPSDKPVFEKDSCDVVFVLGGPGAGYGKGTQCALLVQDYGFVHLSAGDLLRAEQDRAGSQYGDLIRQYIKDGLIVPQEVTIKLLENAMSEAYANPPNNDAWKSGKGRFLIDGFPRKMDQALMFDKVIVQNSLVLFFDTSDEVMVERVMGRAKTSGRADDNVESLKKRFVTFRETSMPVVEYYKEKGLAVVVDASPSTDVVYAEVKKVLAEKLHI